MNATETKPVKVHVLVQYFDSFGEPDGAPRIEKRVAHEIKRDRKSDDPANAGDFALCDTSDGTNRVWLRLIEVIK